MRRGGIKGGWVVAVYYHMDHEAQVLFSSSIDSHYARREEIGCDLVASGLDVLMMGAC